MFRFAEIKLALTHYFFGVSLIHTGLAQSLAEWQRGLLQLGQRISNIHVFCWLQDSIGQQVRQPLSSGEKDWQSLFDTLVSLGGDRFALLEFVLNDDVGQFLADARTLKRLLRFQMSNPSVKPI